MEAALSRRLEEELGFKAPALEILNNREKFLLKGNKYIDYAGKFQYFAQYDGLAEHEIDHVFYIIQVWSSWNSFMGIRKRSENFAG